MKVRTLIKQAKHNNPVLALHTQRWFERRNRFVNAKVICKDPVSLALDWRHSKKKVFCKMGFLTGLILCLITIAASTAGNEYPPLRALSAVAAVSIVPLGIITLGFAISFPTIPTETKRFIQAISLLEKIPIGYDHKRNCPSTEPLGNFPYRLEWEDSSHLCINAKRLLEAQAAEIDRLQKKREQVPWRTDEIDKVIIAKKERFNEDHYALRRLLDIPEDYAHYFGKTS